MQHAQLKLRDEHMQRCLRKANLPTISFSKEEVGCVCGCVWGGAGGCFLPRSSRCLSWVVCGRVVAQTEGEVVA